MVKKPTGKYCSVRCCSIDPERHERLRRQARRGNRRTIVPMARQLSFDSQTWTMNPEEEIAMMSRDREDIPSGMARFAG
ncbi:MAG: hypothetical protein ABR564_00520 [Candidatus Dormibacteria bacterium]